MPRLPSIRRSTIEAMKKNVERINKRMDADPERVLTDNERAALVDAAKVGALLERVHKDDSDEDDSKTVADVEAAARALESKEPAKVSRAAQGAEHDD